MKGNVIPTHQYLAQNKSEVFTATGIDKMLSGEYCNVSYMRSVGRVRAKNQSWWIPILRDWDSYWNNEAEWSAPAHTVTTCVITRGIRTKAMTYRTWSPAQILFSNSSVRVLYPNLICPRNSFALKRFFTGPIIKFLYMTLKNWTTSK
jgi:hypothetical protein